MAGALAAAGDAVGAREAVARATSCRHPGFAVSDPLLELALAWVVAAEGGITKAVATAQSAAELAARSGQWAVEVLARHSCVSFGDSAQSTRLRELAGVVDGPRARLAADHAEGLAAADSDALLITSHAFEAAELALPAAEAAAHAAQIYRRRDNTVKAGEAATRAARLAEDCGARTPALIAAAQPFPISDRQREIATLATRFTNREIAEQLGVSVRTVEGHVYHACTRLGLPNRAALADYVSRVR